MSEEKAEDIRQGRLVANMPEEKVQRQREADRERTRRYRAKKAKEARA